MNKERLVSIDMARGLTIMLVAAFHADLPSSINAVLADVRMPLFFLLSGFLFSRKYFENPQALLKNRMKTLILPYFSAAFFFYIFWVIRTILDNDDTSLSRAFLGIFYGIAPDDWLTINIALWFLVCLFCTQLIFCLLMRYISHLHIYIQLLAVLTVSTIGVLIGKVVYLPWSIDIAMVCQIFMFTGYKLKEHGLLDKIRTFSMVTFVCIMLFSGATYLNGSVDVGFRSYSNVPLFFIAGVSGSIVVLKLMSLLSSINWISKTLSYIGRESLIILIFHGGLFLYATRVLDNRLGIDIHWSIEWIISIVGSLLIAEMIKRISIFNFLFNGKSTNKRVNLHL